MNKIKQGDNVKVMRGKDAGRNGVVLAIVHKQNKRGKQVTRVVVEGVNKVKKHQKPNPTLNLPGGIIEVEKPIDISNVMLIDPKDKKPTRVGFALGKDGQKSRITKKSNTQV